MTARELLTAWLTRQLPPEAVDWLLQAGRRIGDSDKAADVYLAVSLVPRNIGRVNLALDDQDLQAARACAPGWSPQGWSVAQAARLQLLLTLEEDPEQLAACLEQLCVTADTEELVTFYQGLSLYPDPPRYIARTTEGLRTNIRAVFEAIAHNNSYPSQQLPEAAWNQLVLKALFVGSPLWPIVGLDARRNASLATMLCDYAHERWSAKRRVSPELWRCVGPFTGSTQLEDLSRVLQGSEPLEQRAAALALYDSPDPAAAMLLNSKPALRKAIENGIIEWDNLLAEDSDPVTERRLQ